jgi:integrase/recombinase XerC
MPQHVINSVGRISKKDGVRKPPPLASRVLNDYEYWLNKKYGRSSTYLTNAKTFLKTYKQGGTVVSQLDSYAEEKGHSLRSVLKRLKLFLEEKEVSYLINDLNEKKVPLGNIYVKLFISGIQDRLQGDKSQSTYATILNQYFAFIDNDLEKFAKRSAERFINSKGLSDFTRRLYKSVLKNFSDWAIIYQSTPSTELTNEQRIVQKGLKKISLFSLREIASIRVKTNQKDSNKYHKESLTEKQRDRLLKAASTSRDKSILALMAINGLRSVEICRLDVSDCRFKEKKLLVWGKGRNAKSKDEIKFMQTPRGFVSNYLSEYNIKSGSLFPGLSLVKLSAMVNAYLITLGFVNGKYSPHSLRHTAGQIMYDKGVPLEFIRKTLRHSDMRTTLIYAQRAIDRKYFKAMKDDL